MLYGKDIIEIHVARIDVSHLAMDCDGMDKENILLTRPLPSPLAPRRRDHRTQKKVLHGATIFDLDKSTLVGSIPWYSTESKIGWFVPCSAQQNQPGMFSQAPPPAAINAQKWSFHDRGCVLEKYHHIIVCAFFHQNL